MTDRPVRVRFAPSPTGPLHIGGIRTALFNFLHARKTQGTFILRIEDTDRARYVEGAEDYILESLAWCGIEIDEGVSAGGPHAPYRQSERRDIYQAYARQLIETGHAYYAFDTPEELEDLRKRAEQNKQTFTYNQQVRKDLRNSLGLPPEQVSELLESELPVVIRFRMPEDEIVKVNDIVRGAVEVSTRTLDDKILLKADGMPTYHLANVVDDHLMEISHVIRGEEWLPSTPLHVLLYQSFGWSATMPRFGHMPLTLKPDGKGKLSKRDGDRLGFPVFPLQWTDPGTGEISTGYRESGYFPEAFLNILAFLGWNPGTEQEIFSLEELIDAFSLERIVKAGSRFDPEKARWFNHQYLIHKPLDELAEILEASLKEKGIQADRSYNHRVLELVKERAFLIPDLWEQSCFLYQSPEVYDDNVVKKVWKEETPGLLSEAGSLLEEIHPFEAAAIEPALREFVESSGIGFGKLMNPLRLALVGSSKGPGLMDIMELLGKQEVLFRINKALEKIN
jgi:glutamyl-tRNA synthetase